MPRVSQITTQDARGTQHTRPFSFVNRVEGSRPPELGITMIKPGGQTLKNIKTTGDLKVDGKPFTKTKTQEAEVVFAREKEMTAKNIEKSAGLYAFVNELTKIGKLSEKRKSEHSGQPGPAHHGILPAAGLAVAAPLTAGIANGIAAPALINRMKETGAKRLSDRQFGQLRKDLSADHAKWYKTPEGNQRFRLSMREKAQSALTIPRGGVPERTQEAVARQLSARSGISGLRSRKLAREGGVLGPASSPELMAHELGHAGPHGHRVLGKLLRFRNLAIPVAGLAAAGMAGLPEDDNSNLVKAAPFVAGAGMLPMLGDEAQASIRGMRALRRTGRYAPEIMSKMRGNLWKAFGTYGALAAGGVAPVAAYSYYRNRRGKKSEGA